MFTYQAASAQQITIDFEEFHNDTYNTAYTKGLIFTASGNDGYISGGAQPGFSPSSYFRSVASKSACGSGCIVTASSEFHLLDGGPFAFYSANTHAGANPYVDVGVFEGQSAADGTWFSAVDYPDFGQGPWLNVTSVRYSLSESAASATATVQLHLDDVVVEPLLNAVIDFEPWKTNEARPQDDYFVPVGIKTLSILDGEGRDFDATTVNPATATLGSAHAPNVAQPLYHDLDNDGDTDIVLGFRMEKTGITCMLASNEVKLVAQTNTGETIAATDTIAKTGCDGTERLDFEELAVGTTGTFISKGFLLSSVGGSIMNVNGDKVFGTLPCDGEYGGCYFHYASLLVQRADGKPFALYSLDRVTSCGFASACEFSGETVQGDTIYATPSTPVGTGGWLSLRSLRLSVSSVDWPCYYCSISIDDLKVGDGTAVEIDFNPWSADNEIRPKVAGLIAIQINTTSIADGDAVDFDAATVDPASLRLGPSLAEVVSWPLTADYDQDGDTDYIFGFRMEHTGYTCADGLVEIYGNTVDGIAFAGRDSVQPVGCEEPMPVNVEPYSTANRVYPDDNYLVQVAVLSTSVANGDPYNFTGVDRESLRFGPAGAQYQSYFNTDIEPDGDTDTVYTFRMIDTGIACGDVAVTMTGSRSVPGGDIPIPLIGTDSIQTLDCEVGGCHP